MLVHEVWNGTKVPPTQKLQTVPLRDGSAMTWSAFSLLEVMAYVNHKCVANDDAAATHKKAPVRRSPFDRPLGTNPGRDLAGPKEANRFIHM